MNFISTRIYFFLITLFLFSTPLRPQSLFTIRNFSQLENLKISYNYPDFRNPVIEVYSDSTCTHLLEEVNVSPLVKVSGIYTEKDDDGEQADDDATIRPDNYNKKIIESMLKGNYIVSISMLFDDNSFVYGVFKNDLLLWKEYDKGYELTAIYPECMGGCLFCGANFREEFDTDTIRIKYSGKSSGEEWGGEETFTIENDLINFISSTRFRIFTPYKKKGNPVLGASSYSIKKINYNRRGTIAHETFTFDARNPDDSPVMLPAVSDSLPLYRLSFEFPDKTPVYDQTIYTSGNPLRVGPIHGNYITVFWHGKWFATPRYNFRFSSSS